MSGIFPGPSPVGKAGPHFAEIIPSDFFGTNDFFGRRRNFRGTIALVPLACRAAEHTRIQREVASGCHGGPGMNTLQAFWFGVPGLVDAKSYFLGMPAVAGARI